MSARASAPLLGVDYGRRRTGFSLSDPDRILASPAGFVLTRGLEHLDARIREKAEAAGAGAIVLGFPRHDDGRPGDLAAEIEALAGRLRDRGWKVILWDEGLTSWEAERRLDAAGHPRGRQRAKGEIDAAAATVLLQSYLDTLAQGEGRR